MNLGPLKAGYDVMLGNGQGANDVSDNNKRKCFIAALHCKPYEGLRLGLSYYNDEISADTMASHHGGTLNPYGLKVKQQLSSASVVYMGKHVEWISEATLAMNHTDSLGTSHTHAAYAYAGYRMHEKWVPYVRYDVLNYDKKELFYKKGNMKSFLVGLRHQINYQSVIKLEYEWDNATLTGKTHKVSAQFAVGF